jgi:hypothetical protein
MSRLILLFVITITCNVVIGQTVKDVRAGRVIADQGLYVKDTWVDSLMRDTSFINQVRALPTGDAVYKFVVGRIAKINIPSLQSGSGVPSGGLGKDGDTYINGDNKDYYFKSSGSWALIGTLGGGGGGTVVNGTFIGTSTELRSYTGSAKEATTTDNGNVSYFRDTLDNTTVDNLGLCIVDPLNRRWKNKSFNGYDVFANWFGAKGDNTTDNTAAVQAAVNAAYKRRLYFASDGTYRMNRIYMPIDIVWDGNNALFKPSLFPQHNTAIINIAPLFNFANTGLYTGGAASQVTKNSPKITGKIEVRNSRFDLEYTTVTAIDANVSLSNNTIISDVNVHHNKINYFSRRGININADGGNVVDTTGWIEKASVEYNDVRYGGASEAICLDSTYAVGDSIVRIRTIDGEPIARRILVGLYLNWGSHLTTVSGLDNTGYATTNKIYKIRSISQDPTDSTKAYIKILGGSYSSTNGFIDSLKPLTAVTLKNSVMIPIEALANPLLVTAPAMSGVAGSFTMTRSINNTAEDARNKNLYPGMKVQVGQTNYGGMFTIVDVYSDSIHVTPAIPTTFTNQSLIIVGLTGGCLGVFGNLRTVDVKHNTLYGGSRGIGMSGYGGKGKFNEDLLNNLNVEKNIMDYHLMAMEATSGNTVRSTVNSAILDGISTTAGSNTLTFLNPSTIRLGTPKDFDGDGVTDKFITNVATTDGNATGLNSLMVGDIICWYGLAERYKVIDLSATTITLARYSHAIKDTVPGGLEATVADADNYFRVYSISGGQEGSFRRLTIKDNTFRFSWRNQGGSGYAASVRAYDLNIEGNQIEYGEHTAFELEGYNVNITKKNILKLSAFDGSFPIPSLSKTNGAGGRTGGGIGSLIGTRTYFSGNDVICWQPGSGYSSGTGGVTIGPSAFSMWPSELLEYSNNNIKNLQGPVMGVVNLKTISGVTYPTFYYKQLVMKGNNITLANTYFNTGLYNYWIGRKTNIEGNIFTKEGTTPISSDILMFRVNQRPSPELIDSTTWDLTIANNQYPRSTIMNTPFALKYMKYGDNLNKIFGISVPSTKLLGLKNDDPNTIVPIDPSEVGGGGTGNGTTGKFD